VGVPLQHSKPGSTATVRGTAPQHTAAGKASQVVAAEHLLDAQAAEDDAAKGEDVSSGSEGSEGGAAAASDGDDAGYALSASTSSSPSSCASSAHSDASEDAKEPARARSGRRSQRRRQAGGAAAAGAGADGGGSEGEGGAAAAASFFAPRPVPPPPLTPFGGAWRLLTEWVTAASVLRVHGRDSENEGAESSAHLQQARYLRCCSPVGLPGRSVAYRFEITNLAQGCTQQRLMHYLHRPW
jgi:hypothetical protein